MRFQSLGLPSHSFLSFQSLREPYPAITSRVFVFLYDFNVLFICLISLSRGFCSPLFLYLLYHKFPVLLIVFSKKNKIFFTFSGLIAGLPFFALVSKNCLNYQNLVKFGAWRPCAAIALKARPLQNKNARKSPCRTSFYYSGFCFFIFSFRQSIGVPFCCQPSFSLH